MNGGAFGYAVSPVFLRPFDRNGMVLPFSLYIVIGFLKAVFYFDSEVFIFMKKIIRILIVLCLFAGVLSGCGSKERSADQLSIVTTIFPEYDWVKQILGDQIENAQVTLLLDNGVDLHSYQPTANDIVTISACDMFVYVGGESDEWVDDVLAQATNKDMIIVNLLDVLGDAVKEEEMVDGMEHEEEHVEEAEEHEYDEHVWLSLRNAQTICKTINEKICELDPENADAYTANTESYCQKLTDLDGEYSEAVSAASMNTLLFADRFPFRYLTDDYGIEYYAAFSGCSAESEASFDTIVFLAGKVDELGLTSVITLKGSDADIAQTIISTSTGKNAKTLILDSMQTTTAKDADGGTTYLRVMESNLEVLKEALQ